MKIWRFARHEVGQIDIMLPIFKFPTAISFLNDMCELYVLIVSECAFVCHSEQLDRGKAIKS